MKRSGRKSKAPGKRNQKRGGRRLRSKRSSNVPDIAKCSVKTTLTPPAGGNFAGNQMYSLMNTTLAQFDRAVNVSKAYQFYRIKKIKLTYLFPYDTFQAGVGGSSRPNMFFMLDKSGSINPLVTLAGLKQMGARPKAVDNKPTSIQWTPTVLTEDQTLVGALPAQYKISPWLSTSVPNVTHLGVYWYLDQLFAGGTQYQVECEVQFEFKKPLWNESTTTSPAQGAVLAVLDNSPDGIVGGGDVNTIVAR